MAKRRHEVNTWEILISPKRLPHLLLDLSLLQRTLRNYLFNLKPGIKAYLPDAGIVVLLAA